MTDQTEPAKKPQNAAEWSAAAHKAEADARGVEFERLTGDHDDTYLGQLIRKETALRQYAKHCAERADIAIEREGRAARAAAIVARRDTAKQLVKKLEVRAQVGAVQIDTLGAQLIALMRTHRAEGRDLGAEYLNCAKVLVTGRRDPLHESLSLALPHVRGDGSAYATAIAKLLVQLHDALSAETSGLVGFSSLVISNPLSTSTKFQPYSFADAAQHAVTQVEARLAPLLEEPS